ncbi:phosphatidate cytidylyltransferase [Terrimonas pollutisoli]|uniref:phosphatidate cytidylyltransferase n=1 Tax=Terrimonas pollutisoli TaxID=3034147 RepID=UPI0023EDCFAA|nr:phosphatidate cytidylyltransferase [Terrimonas sp. H1YJ31]
MAFNWQTFRTRALTAIVFVVVMLGGLLWNHWSFLVLFSVIHFGCWWEYFKLVEKINTTYFHIYTKLGLMLIGYGLMLWFCGPVYNLAGYGLKENFSLPVSAAGFFLLLTGIFQKYKVELKSFGAAALGLIYISLSWGLMMNLRIDEIIDIGSEGGDFFKDNNGFLIPMLIIFSIWINDTMAYIVGSLIGKTPLSKISPKKTWEGTVGGVILAVTVITFFLQPLLYWKYLLAISLIAAIAGTFGDLLESKLKRMAGVKDSGQIMPGHGGFLDRFDSLVFATPFVWLYVNFFML